MAKSSGRGSERPPRRRRRAAEPATVPPGAEAGPEAVAVEPPLRAPAPSGDGRKRLNLALQGGGAHGAFTWGVCDRLLAEERIEIEGIVGTSAGAMNAAALVDGYVADGREGARAALDRFWHGVAEAARFGPVQRGPIERMSGSWRLDGSPAYLLFDLLSRVMSPYQLNPMNFNPLRDVLDKTVNFERLQSCTDIKLFVCATNVRTGKVRVFRTGEVSRDAVLASACLPFLFHTVEIEGEAYWDGGYMGNPALFPVIYDCESPDVVIVQINPLFRDEVPRTAREILDRMNEISFNSSLMREMRAVAFVTRLIDEGQLDRARYKRMNIHMIEADDEIRHLGASTKLNADLDFLLHLRDIGREAADRWLAARFDSINVESTVDLVETYL